MSRRLRLIGAVGCVVLVAALLPALACETSSVTSTPQARPTAAEETITVTGQRRQVIHGWGASVGGDTFLDPQASRLGLSRLALARLEYALYRKAGINLLRIFNPRLGRGDGRWALMRRARPWGVRFVFTVGDIPAAMKQGEQRLRPGAEARFALYVARSLAFARRLGVPFSLAAIGNEPDASGSALQLDSAQAAKVFDRLARQIRSRGLATRLALADNLNWTGAARYARAALASKAVRGLTGAITTHSYGGNDSREEVGSIARANGLPIWMTEYTSGCPKGDCPDKPGIGFALRWATQITRDLTFPGVNAWFVLRSVDDSSHGPDSGILVRTRGGASPFYPTKRFHVLRQFSSAARPGARRLEVNGRLPALAFTQGDRLSLVVTNAGGHGIRAALRLGGRSGSLSVRRTSARESFRRLKPRRYDGEPIEVLLPARSVSTFTLLP